MIALNISLKKKNFRMTLLLVGSRNLYNVLGSPPFICPDARTCGSEGFTSLQEMERACKILSTSVLKSINHATV